MTFSTQAACAGAAALLFAAAAGAQARTGSGIPISKDAPPPTPAVTTTNSAGEVAAPVSPAVLPTFSVASYGALNEKNMTAIMAGGDSLEIQLGHLAHSKGTAQSVRDYGMMLANDHTAHLAKVTEVITDEDVGAQAPANDVEGARPERARPAERQHQAGARRRPRAAPDGDADVARETPRHGKVHRHVARSRDPVGCGRQAIGYREWSIAYSL
jgi:predicted outer membrane protein